MSTQRITITVPDDVYQNLIKHVSHGGVSSFITKLLRETLFSYKVKEKEETFTQAVMRVREKTPKYSTEEIIDMIQKGRK